MKFYKDEDNTPCAADDGGLALLAGFLESDIQGDRNAAMELFQFLEKKEGQRTGNAYDVEFDAQHVTITELEGAGESQQINRMVFFQAVEAWLVFIGD